MKTEKSNKGKKLIRITTVPQSWSLFSGQMKYMQQWYDVIAIAAPTKLFDKYVKKENVPKAIGVSMTRQLTPFKDLKSLWQMIGILRRERPFIVHTHTPKAGIVGMLASWIYRVPIRIHTVAGMPLLVHNGLRKKLLLMVERLTYACATKVLPNSFKMAEVIQSLHLAPEDKIKVLANGSTNGIDTSYFDPDLYSEEFRFKKRLELGIKQNDFVFIFVGRLVRDKGINELIEAFERSEQPNVKLLLVGSYEEKLDPLAPETILEIKNNRNIIEAGWQEDVRLWFAISDALVFPSYREGFPNVVMQAGAMGLPSIVTNINGCNEIILEGKNGSIIPPQDVDSLHLAMMEMLKNKEKRDFMRNNARTMITSRYEQKKVWEAVLAEYQLLESELKKKNNV